MSGKLICTFCDTEVEEDTSNGPKTDSRTMLAKYNTQVSFVTIQARAYLQTKKFRLKFSREGNFCIRFGVKWGVSFRWRSSLLHANGSKDHREDGHCQLPFRLNFGRNSFLWKFALTCCDCAKITLRWLSLDCTALWASQEFRKCRIYTNHDWSRTELCWGLFRIQFYKL